jgi:erythrin-vacuolar iron transport family protein
MSEKFSGSQAAINHPRTKNIATGFAEALSNHGVLSGRGRPWIRGGVCGLMTTRRHWPYFAVSPAKLFHCSLGCGSGGGSRIRRNRLDKEALYGYPLLQAIFQVVPGGLLVFIAGFPIGNL